MLLSQYISSVTHAYFSIDRVERGIKDLASFITLINSYVKKSIMKNLDLFIRK